ncbi:MAG: hypothetical protein EAY75_04515 [Bacteroidetes bacterium]|nr:MAG: hypothetical protein EAY75_04515 [Bacteroidota bacterium]
MKNFILAGLVAFSTLAATAAPKKQGVAVSLKSLKAFESEFGNVANVGWSNALNNMLCASFWQDNEMVKAYFTQNGEYVGSTVRLTTDDVPRKLRNNIAAKYPGYTIVEAFELRTTENISTYTKLQKDGDTVLLKGNTSGYFSRVSEDNPY